MACHAADKQSPRVKICGYVRGGAAIGVFFYSTRPWSNSRVTEEGSDWAPRTTYSYTRRRHECTLALRNGIMCQLVPHRQSSAHRRRSLARTIAKDEGVSSCPYAFCAVFDRVHAEFTTSSLTKPFIWCVSFSARSLATCVFYIYLTSMCYARLFARSLFGGR